MGWEAAIDPELARRLAPLMRRGIVAVITSLLLAGCSDACSNTPVIRLEAPDGLHTAILFQRDCGATSGFSTQASVLAAGEEFPAGVTLSLLTPITVLQLQATGAARGPKSSGSRAIIY